MEYVLKLGGSVLTDKKEEGKLSENFSKIIGKVAENPGGVIIHGAGSYGHPPAKRHGLASGSREGVLETHRAVKELNRKVVDELRDRGVKAIPVHPLSMSYRDPDTEIMVEHVFKMAEEGFTPVIHGDGIVTSGEGFTVISGDEILAKIEKEAETGRAGFCASVDGVLDSEGKMVEKISSMNEFEDQEVEGIDVSGGMKAKLEEIFEHDVNARIFGKDQLEGFFSGEEVGTEVRAR
ncbi:MAG: isopentenyl phosphate kinase [Candidatus Nanosalina sp.]